MHTHAQITFDPISPTCYKHPFCAGMPGGDLRRISMPFSRQIPAQTPNAAKLQPFFRS